MPTIPIDLIIETVLSSYLSRNLMSESEVPPDIEAMERFKSSRHFRGYGFSPSKEAVLLLTNGQAIYLDTHSFINNETNISSLGAIRISLDCNAVTLSTIPTQQQLSVLPRLIHRLLRGSFDIEFRTDDLDAMDGIKAFRPLMYYNFPPQVTEELPRQLRQEVDSIRNRLKQTIKQTYTLYPDSDIASFIADNFPTEERLSHLHDQLATQMGNIMATREYQDLIREYRINPRPCPGKQGSVGNIIRRMLGGKTK